MGRNIYEFNFREDSEFEEDNQTEFPTDRNFSHRVVFNDGASWMTVLTSFISFLESVYEYPIKDEVEVKGERLSERDRS